MGNVYYVIKMIDKEEIEENYDSLRNRCLELIRKKAQFEIIEKEVTIKSNRIRLKNLFEIVYNEKRLNKHKRRVLCSNCEHSTGSINQSCFCGLLNMSTEILFLDPDHLPYDCPYTLELKVLFDEEEEKMKEHFYKNSGEYFEFI